MEFTENMTVNGDKIAHVTESKYIGSLLIRDNDCNQETHRWIAKAAGAMAGFKTIKKSKVMIVETKLEILRTCKYLIWKRSACLRNWMDAHVKKWNSIRKTGPDAKLWEKITHELTYGEHMRKRRDCLGNEVIQYVQAKVCGRRRGEWGRQHVTWTDNTQTCTILTLEGAMGITNEMIAWRIMVKAASSIWIRMAEEETRR